MLTFLGSHGRYCDRIPRRGFLKVGALAIGGLTLADLLRARAMGATRDDARPKSVIMIYLGGGPSHLDTYDLKPNAPKEIRGEFSAIDSNVPGIRICEHLPKQASIMDKLAVVRGINFGVDEHGAHLVMTGFPQKVRRPAFGSVVSYQQKTEHSDVPPYVSLSNFSGLKSSYELPEYTGMAHGPFSIAGPGVENLKLASGVTLERLNDRKGLLARLDGVRREMDYNGALAGVDAYTAQAIDLISSPKARDAFDSSKEPAKVRDRYGKANAHMLTACRLVEAGVSVVTLSASGGWDTHNNNFKILRGTLLPSFDQGIHALVTDLHERGLDKDVAVVAWGEFGRTPKINTQAGRDHWPSAGFVLFAGGGFKTGQVIGETDSTGSRVKGRPYGPNNILATLYHHLGLNPTATIPDFNGRPMHLLDDPQPVRELL